MKKLLIIGAGVAGLSAGIHAQLLGFESVVVEKAPKAGGISAYWHRGEYRLEASMHWLVGTRPGSELNRMWRTLGVLGSSTGTIELPYQAVYEIGGEVFRPYADIKKLKAELLRIAPEDGRYVRQLIRDIKVFSHMQIPSEAPVDLLPLKKKLKLLLPMLAIRLFVGKRAGITNFEYVERFKSPVLKEYFTIWPQGQAQHSGYLFKAGMMGRKDAEYPEGGAKGFSENMARRYQELGGRLLLGKEAVAIEVKDGWLECVRFKDGECMQADYLLCACDPDITLNGLLGGKYPVPEFEERYRDTAHYYVNSCCIAFFGLDMRPEWLEDMWFKAEPITAAGSSTPWIYLRTLNNLKDTAPQGHTALYVDILQSEADFEYWHNLRSSDMAAYNAEKERFARQVERRLLTRFPEWEGHLELVDVYTPATYHRYTGAYKGAWMGFRATGGGVGMTHTGQIPGLSNILLTGQWLQPPGGLPVAAAMGKFSVQRLAHREGMEYMV